MTKKERAVACVELLKAEFPDDLCSLTYEDPYQLLVAVRLSAQCTDARVNMVTPALFEKYPTPVEMAAADVEDVEKLIRSTGFFRTKARDLVIMANQILDGFDGKVPSTIEELTSLQGVGRKTANLIAGDIYGGVRPPQTPAAGGVQQLLPPLRAPRPCHLHRPESTLRALLSERRLQEDHQVKIPLVFA